MLKAASKVAPEVEGESAERDRIAPRMQSRGAGRQSRGADGRSRGANQSKRLV